MWQSCFVSSLCVCVWSVVMSRFVDTDNHRLKKLSAGCTWVSVCFFDCKTLVILVAARELSAVLCSTVSGMWWNWSWSKNLAQEVPTSMLWVNRSHWLPSILLLQIQFGFFTLEWPPPFLAYLEIFTVGVISIVVPMWLCVTLPDSRECHLKTLQPVWTWCYGPLLSDLTVEWCCCIDVCLVTSW